jgi:hypothetical protein
MVTDKLTDWTRLPDVPVTITATVPVVDFAAALSVSRLVLAVGFVEKLAVTPFGNPVTASFTVPAKPPTGFTAMLVVVLLPCVMDKFAGEAVKLNPGAGFTVSMTDEVAVA